MMDITNDGTIIFLCVLIILGNWNIKNKLATARTSSGNRKDSFKLSISIHHSNLFFNTCYKNYVFSTYPYIKYKR